MLDQIQLRDVSLLPSEEAVRQLNADLERGVQERTSALAEANKELESFSYSVSHDLRAPLRHIDGYLSLLSKSIGPLLDEKSKHYLDTISESAKHMGRLIDELLAFSRTSRAEMRVTRVDLNELAKATVSDLAMETQGRNIAWKIHPLPAVDADPTLMRQVWVNLLSNAVKYTRGREQAQIEIGSLPGPTFSAAKSGTNGEPTHNGEHVFFVRDNGAGFDMQYVEKLFSVFQRLHRSDQFEGVGMGLAIVRRVIHRHHGRTWAEGKVDGGATFYFTLPKEIRTSRTTE